MKNIENKKNYVKEIETRWIQIVEEMKKMPAFKKIGEGNLGVEHYKAAVRQIYLQTRDNPQQQATWTLRFVGAQRKIIKKVLAHAMSEVGHDQLALKDIEVIGEKIEETSTYRPLPGTAAMKCFSYHAAMNERPAVYLGYVYHLEGMAVNSGKVWSQQLQQIGVPEEALKFVEEHSQFDVAHMKLNEEYISVLVTNEQELEDFLYGAHTASVLYGRMLEDAFNSADQGIPARYKNPSEKISYNKETIEEQANAA